MVETSNKYVTCYVKNGKVVDQHFLSSPDEVKTMEAVGRAKGYETETYAIDCCSLSEKSESVENDIAQSEEPSQQHKRPWNKWVKCIETGQVFPTVRECSSQMGIPYMTLRMAMLHETITLWSSMSVPKHSGTCKTTQRRLGRRRAR